MNTHDFKKYGYQLVDQIAEYFENIDSYPVRPNLQPGEIYKKLPQSPPSNGESMDEILRDFNEIIIPGMTHWQHPGFHGYFPANNSFPSILGEFLTASLGAQCMKWETSPAATELEQIVIEWLRKMICIPEGWSGVIQDTASTATLCAILTVREKISNYKTNQSGISGNKLRVYCSEEAHSSVEKAVKIAGIGSKNLIKIATNDKCELIPSELSRKIESDINDGFNPLCIVAALGTTGTTAVDPLEEIGTICKDKDIWLHVDAAYAGSAMILEEYRWMNKGLEYADSFVFNPHKWLFTNFDCSAYFVKDQESLVKTFQLVPEYLKTDNDNKVNNYSDWGIQLGRRFRALKLWFVIRNFGVEGLKEKIRNHIHLARIFEKMMKESGQFEILQPPLFNLVCFRWTKHGLTEQQTEVANKKMLTEVNRRGKIFITHTKIKGRYSLRFVCGQTDVTEKNIETAVNELLHCSKLYN